MEERVPHTPGSRVGVLTFLLAPQRRSSILQIAVQPSISTIPCNCFYSLANAILAFRPACVL